MKKSTLLIAALAVSTLAFGQFRWQSNTGIGQVLTSNTTTGENQFDVHFNTDKAASTVVGTATPYVITLNKAQTQRGLQVKVFYSKAGVETEAGGNDMKCNNYGGNGNPARMASMTSLYEILDAYQANANATEPVSVPKNNRDSAAHCLFDIATDNQAFGAYPGKFKIVEYGFYFDFTGKKVNSDLKFDMDTYYEGANLNGATAKYTVKVYVGGNAAGNLKATLADFYTTGTGKKTVSVAADASLQISDFNNQKVYLVIRTEGTGTPIASGTVDPIVVFDNFAVNYQSPLWITPAANANVDQVFNNQAEPFTGTINETSQTSVLFQTKDRAGAFTCIIDPVFYVANNGLSFPATGAVKANDGNGNYTVDVAYTLTTGTQTPFPKVTLTIAAPTSGFVSDDMKITLNVLPTSTTAVPVRLETSCGVRLYYDLYYKGEASTAVKNNKIDGSVYVSNSKLFVVTTLQQNVEVRNVCGQTVGVYAAADAANGIALAKGIYLVTTGGATSKVVVK